MDELIRAINRYPDGTKLIIKYKINFAIKGEIDTIYETNNEFDENEEGYEEYYACAFNVKSVQGDVPKEFDVEVGSLIEVSMQKPPLGVYLENGTTLWERGYN